MWDHGYCAEQESTSNSTPKLTSTAKPKQKSTPRPNSSNNDVIISKFDHPNNSTEINTNVIEQIPFQVSLSSNTKFPVSFCGGVLINKNTGKFKNLIFILIF